MNPSSKQKLIFLAVGILLSLFLCYQLAIKKTLALRSDLTALEHELVSLRTAGLKIQQLKSLDEEYDQALNRQFVSSELSFQNNLLTNLNEYLSTNQLELVAFEEPHIFQNQDTRITTNQFSVKGTYVSILQLVNTIEQLGSFGSVASLQFEKRFNYKTNKSSLVCKVMLERVEGR